MDDSDNESSFDNVTNFNFRVVEPPVWSVYLFICIIVIIMVLAIVGNGVILAVEQFNKQKTSTDWLVTFMSVNDLVLAGFNIPVYILMYNGSWKSVASDALCGFSLYIQEGFSYSSTLLLTATAIDRYVKTCHPLAIGITPRRSLFMCMGISLFALTFTSVIPYYAVYDEYRQCRYDASDNERAVLKAMVLFLQVTYILTFLIVIVSYFKIAVTIRLRIRKLHNRSAYPVGNHQPSFQDPVSQRNTFSAQTVITKLTARNNVVAPMPSQGTEHTIALPSVSGKFPEPSIGDKTSISNNETMLKSEDNTTHETKVDDNGQVPEDHPADGTIKYKETKERRKQRNNHNPKEAQMNKTTVIMFAVTLVFILSWIPPWMITGLWPDGAQSVSGSVGLLFSRRSFLVNTCTNPLFYIGMSSAFRQMTKQNILKIWFRIQLKTGIIQSP